MVVSDAPAQGAVPGASAQNDDAVTPQQVTAQHTEVPVAPPAPAPVTATLAAAPVAAPPQPDAALPAAMPVDTAPELARLPAEHPIHAPMAGMPDAPPVIKNRVAPGPPVSVPPAPDAKPAPAELALPTVSPSENVSLESGQSNNYLGIFGAPALRKVQQPTISEPAADTDDETIVAGGAASTELGEVKAHWEAFLKYIQGERIHVSALLQHTRPIQLQEETLVLSVPDDFHKRMLSNQQEFLLDTLCNFVMVPVERLGFVIDMVESEELLQQETASEIDPYEYMQKQRNESPIIRALFDEFGGEMVW